MLKYFQHSASAVKQKTLAVVEVFLGRAFTYSKSQFLYHNLSFSQEGEDGVMMRIFERQEYGFYVDVGAHHPQRFSNTYRFYLRGWRGINIDPLPGSKAKFDLLRGRDINLEIGISLETGTLTYYAFEEPAFNTFDPVVAKTRSSRLRAKHEIVVKPLRDILSEHVPPKTVIDFLTIDVEGLDLAVLQSNDWSKFRPRYILAEALGMHSIRHVQQTELHSFMESVGYSLFAKTVNTLFFINESS